MPDEISSQKKPLFSRGTKRSIISLALFLSLPVVLLGALTQQNTEQEAAESRGKPNIILIQTANQRAESLDALPLVKETLGGRGVTFTNAISSVEGFVVDTQLLDGYSTKVLGDAAAAPVTTSEEAISFISSADGPFFLHVTLHPAQAAASCENAPVTNPAVNEADVSDKPQSIRALPRLSGAELQRISAERRLHDCGLQAIDSAVQEIVGSLGEERENTVVIYAGKNGYARGEHRVVGANCAYDACLRVPLVISYPQLTRWRVVSGDAVSPVDVTATIAELVGVEQNVGRSLVPILLDPRATVREAALIEAINDESGIHSSAIRTREWKYIEHSTGERELYDLVSDPHELTNLYGTPLYTAQSAELSTKLAVLRSE